MNDYRNTANAYTVLVRTLLISLEAAPKLTHMQTQADIGVYS